MSASTLLDKPGRSSLIFRMLHRNATLRLRYYWREDMPTGSLPTARQVCLWQDTSRRVAAITGRKVLKTTFIESSIICSAFDNLTGLEEENLFTTPGDAHMSPVLTRIENRIDNTPLFRTMKKDYNKNDGILEFKSRVMWYFRIEGVDGTGRNMVGLRAKRIIGDEQAFGAQRAHDARVQVARSPTETSWLYTGVPNGVRLTPFWKIDQDPIFGKQWSIHRMSSFENPAMRTPEAKIDLASSYGGENAQEYINNVLGEWGEERGSTFPSSHLSASQSMVQPYALVEISDTLAMARRAELGQGSIPWRNLMMPFQLEAEKVGPHARCSVIGIDHGFSPDPTVAYVSYLDGPDTDRAGEEIWRLLGCLTLYRITASEHADFIDNLRNILLDSLATPVLGICADMMGYAKATYTDFLFADPRFANEWYLQHVLAANFGGTDILKDEFGNDIKDASGLVVRKRRKQTSTELLKDMFAANIRDAQFVDKFL